MLYDDAYAYAYTYNYATTTAAIENAYAKTAAPGDLWSRRVTFGRRSTCTVDMPCGEPMAFEIHRGSSDAQIGSVRCSSLGWNTKRKYVIFC